MTESQAEETIRVGQRHIGGDSGAHVVPYACIGGFAVVIPVPSQPSLWYLLTDYHANTFEDLGAAVAAPPVTWLFPDTLRSFHVTRPEALSS